MQILAYLIPISLVLGGVGLLAFVYTVRTDQYDDPEGDAKDEERIGPLGRP